MSRQKQIVSTPNAPLAIGPYSQGVIADGFVFTAMQIPLDPATGELVAGGVEAQTRRVMESLRAILEAAGSSLGQAVKVTVYMTDLTEFATVNPIYGEFFPTDRPARAVVGVAALPRGARIAVEATALV